MRQLFIAIFIVFSVNTSAQNWQQFTDSIPTLSSPRCSDLNADGILDIVIGGGTDSIFSNNGVMAYNGLNGALLWKRSSRDEIFGSAIFQDINNDSIKDVFITGRTAQLLAINGADGSLIWEYFPNNLNPADSGLYNFYNPQFIDDIDGDNYQDILVSNGGDNSAPDWQTNRPPGYLMIISSLTGNMIVKSVVPDSAETYCSPLVVDVKNTGNKWILYGTGGENLGGHFYAAPLSDLIQGNLSGSTVLAADTNKGFIAPASVYRNDSSIFDIIIQSFDGLVTKISGQSFSPLWTYQKAGTESSAEPIIGNFTGDLTPDISLVLFNGVAPSYNDYYQVILDGQDGTVAFIDSLGAINFSSANAVDINNDGRDEGIYSITYNDNGIFRNRVEAVDFTNNSITTLDQTRTGVNIGSTPLIADLDNNGLLDMVYSVKKDSLNPMGWKGIYIYRHELPSIIPNSGIAWGSYLGTNTDGVYNNKLINCGTGSIISNISTINPCNDSAEGSINLNVFGNSGPYTYLWSNQENNTNIDSLIAGSYWVQVTDSTGCHELRTINLNNRYTIGFGGITLNACTNDSNGIATVGSSGCQCMTSTCTYLWDNGVTIKNNFSLTNGWNSVIITHADGCVVTDSVLIGSNNNTSLHSSNHTSCDIFTWDSIAYTQSGMYTNTYTNTAGCDSIHTILLTITNSNQDTTYITQCDSYTWDSIVYTQSGIHTNTYTNTAGCDSIHTILLTITNSYLDTTYITQCDSYIWDSIVYTQSGMYTNTYTNTVGCDSISTISLTINDIYSINNTIDICSGDTTMVGNSIYTVSGNYTDSLYSINGCDSNITTQLTVHSNILVNISQTGNNLQAIISGGSPTYSYQWNTGENTSQITPTVNGEYWVLIMDINECISDTAYFTVDWISTYIRDFTINDIAIYPNPSTDIFTLKFTNLKSQDIKIKVLNILGEELILDRLENHIGDYTKEINLYNNCKGIYFLEIETNYKVINKRLILQ